MTGFRNFVLRGNVVDIAVGLIIAVSFGAVVTTFTEWLTGLMPDTATNIFSTKEQSFGAFLNAVVAFLLMALVIYYFVVVPYTKAKERFFPSPEPGTPEDIQLLTEIRDALQARGGSTN